MMSPAELKSFKKVKSDEKTTTLMHPNGHRLTIAHGALSEKVRKQLHEMPVHMAEGGMAEQDQSKAPVNINISTQPQQPNQMPQAAPQMPAPPQEEPGFLQKMAGLPMSLYSPESNAQAAAKNQAIDANAAQANGIAPQPETQAPPEQAPGLDQPAPMQSAPSPQDEFGYGAMGQQYMEGVKGIQSGLQEEAQAKGALGAQEAKTFHDQQQQQQQQLNDYNKHYGDLMQERDNFMRDYTNGHIDPKRVFKNMDTTQKITTAVGLILGGIGGGILHQDNPALKFLNNQIDRDVEAQRADLDKGHNLLSANMQQFGNLRDAMAATQIMQKDIVAAKLGEQAAKSTNAVEAAKYKQLSNKLLMDSAPMMQQLAMQKSLMSGLSQANNPGQGEDRVGGFISKLRVIDPKRAEEMAKRYIPGVGLGTIEVPDAARNEITARQDFDKRMTALINFSKKNSGSLSPTIINQGKAMARGLQDAARQAANLGVFKESENEFMNSIISDNPTAIFSNVRVIPGYQVAKKNNAMSLNTKKKAYGFPVTEPKVADQGWTK